jgi:site-specific recombinase XerD
MQFQVRSIVPKRGSYRVLRVSLGYLFWDLNPLELIESPKTGRKLPDTLSIDEIDTLIKAIDLTSNEAEPCDVRNLIWMWSSGLELVSLKISDLFFEEGFIKITGKGNKQRCSYWKLGSEIHPYL